MIWFDLKRPWRLSLLLGVRDSVCWWYAKVKTALHLYPTILQSQLNSILMIRLANETTHKWAMTICLGVAGDKSNTRSRPQSSPRLLAATKARASPNQLNNFNVSAESHTRQHPTLVSNVYVCMTSALPPVFILIGVLPSYLYNPPSTH